MTPPPAELANFLAGWNSPPMEYRPAVLWSWNGRMTPARIRATLRDFAARNIGGVFVHPRPGLVTEYLSEDWFDLWALALEECVRLGLGCHIYDENSFPSGFAGGHVLSRNPLAATSRLTGHWIPEHIKMEKPAGCRMGFLARDPSAGVVAGLPAAERIPEYRGSKILALDLEKAPSSLWTGGFPMADTCRAEVVGQFLASTHEVYEGRFCGEFGRSIGYLFTDEPETGTGDDGYYMSRQFLRAFLEEHGYPLESRLADLCGNRDGSSAVRHDYFRTLNRLFTENFSREVSDWCGKRGLKFTGHYLENQWPLPVGAPNTMAAQQWMHAPGIDLLGFQFRRSSPADNSLWLLTVKEATSIAAQLGRGEVLCECSGGGGYEFGPADMKPLEDFLLALGVNRLVPHLSHESLAGARKYDWPQTLSDHSPWWDSYGDLATHIARANYSLSQGSENNRTLVLHPTTTGWLHYIPACFHWPGETPNAPLLELRSSHANFLAELYSAQLDYDLGDECVMERVAKVADGHLVVGGRAYGTVVIPEGMENMLGSTVRLLEDFLAGGGVVVCAGKPPPFVNGRRAQLGFERFPGWVTAREDLVGFLRERHKPRLAGPRESALPPELLWRYSHLPQGGAILFFANPTSGPLSATIEAEGGDVIALDTHSGAMSRMGIGISGKRFSAELQLPPGEHALWWVSPSELSGPPLGVPRKWNPIPLGFCGCAPLEPNVLPLDYCDYAGPGTRLKNANTIIADTANWHAHGFDQNLWRVSIQFRRTFVDAEIKNNSGFRLRFPFLAEEDLILSEDAADLVAAIERPWLYEISCNGVGISQENAVPWFDEDTRLINIGSAVVAGTNIIELRARSFDVLAEIAPIVLRGQFRAIPGASGFVLKANSRWAEGRDWGFEGWPFYPWKTLYRFRFSTRSVSAARLIVPEFQGSAAGVQLDDLPPIWSHQNGRCIPFPDPLPAGDHTLGITLCGNLKNFLGPHFHDGLPGAWSWENCPSSLPPGATYEIRPTGLIGSPRLETSPL